MFVKYFQCLRNFLQERQSRIATLYLPFLTIILEHAGRFPGSHNVDRTWSSSQTMLVGSDQITETGTDFYPPSRRMTAASLNESANKINVQVPFDEDETKNLILCLMYILKNLEQGMFYGINIDSFFASCLYIFSRMLFY